MPVIQIKALPQQHPDKIQTAIQQLCCEVAAAIDVPKHQVWAIWEDIKPGFYVEGDNPANEQPIWTHPPIIEITAFEGRSKQAIENMISTTAEVLSRELGIENNLFITYTEAKSGQVYTGGELRYKD